MLRKRRILVALKFASLAAVVLCAAALGWYAGRILPLATWESPRDQGSAATSPPAQIELSLHQQIANVVSGASATIHLEASPVTPSDLESLRGLKQLQILLLDNVDNALGDDECAILAELQNLIHLRIRGGSIGDRGLAHLARLPNLKILNLPQSRVTDQGLAPMAAMPKLSQLRLGSRQITNKGLLELAQLPALRQLHLIDAPITDKGLDEIERFPQLQSLYLDGSLVTGSGLDQLYARFPRLHIHINQQHHDRDPQRDHE